jgi:hypothetical protein
VRATEEQQRGRGEREGSERRWERGVSGERSGREREGGVPGDRRGRTTAEGLSQQYDRHRDR